MARYGGKVRSILIVAGIMAGACLVPVANAQGVTSLSCSPSVIEGGSGGAATCTVALSAAAPSGGTVVSLASSLIELAASHPTVTVPSGQTTASFVVATNPGYRRYSQLAFQVTITASANGTSRSSAIDVTAQPRPGGFNSGSDPSANTQWEGLMCGGIAPIGGYSDILYNCSRARRDQPGICTFHQECRIGCRRVPPNGEKYNDFCATTGPNPIAISRRVAVGGDRVAASVVAEAPAGSAPAREQGVPRVIDPNFNSTKFPQSGIAFPIGATSVPFDVATSIVPAIQFVEVAGFWFNDAVPPLLITNGRGGREWLVLLSPPDPPAVAIPTLGDFRITGSNPVSGGTGTIGQIDLSGLSRAGGPTITLTSSHPDIVPSTSVVAPQTEKLFGFQVSIATNPPAADTDVTITATDGRYSFSAVLRVLAPPPPPVLADLTVDPASVEGGNPSTGTVFLSEAQSANTVVSLSTPAPSSVATIPSSVTVPAGATSATFTITTFPVAETFNMNIYADLAGSPGQQALLLITPGSGPTLSSLALSPTSVVGGTGSTGTVTLSAAAPSGGAVVSLASNNAAASVPASVTVAAGATSASFAITTSTVTASTTATISATYNGVTASAALTVNPQTTDTVGIQRAEYRNPELRVEATSTSSTATLRVYVTATNELIGTLSNKGSGRYEGNFNWPVNPQSITVRSSLGGSATKTVTTN